MTFGSFDCNIFVFQRQRQTLSLHCTMSLERYCTGRWATSYLRQSEYSSVVILQIFQIKSYCRLLSVSSLIPSCTSTSVLSFNTFWQLFSSLVVVFIYLFPFSLPFYFCALSSVVSYVYLIPTSNFLPLCSSCLPCYQTCLGSPKKYISLDVLPFFCFDIVFLEMYSGLRMGAGLMGPETCIELAKIEVSWNQEIVRRPLWYSVCAGPGPFYSGQCAWLWMSWIC